MFRFFRNRRRRQIRNRPFPVTWHAIIKRGLPFYGRLSEEDRLELQGHILVFLDEKRFEGCGGLVITDEIRVIIAAQACLLLLHRETNYFPRLSSVLVYPKGFRSSAEFVTADGLVTADHDEFLGESWASGSVVLSWKDARRGGANPSDGVNVVIHEFAHQLDHEDGLTDGVPILGSGLRAEARRQKYIAWEKVMKREFERLRQQDRDDEETLLDPYGAEEPAEFFAVATECFFERSDLMKQHYPELYAELSDFYKQDPASWKRGT